MARAYKNRDGSFGIEPEYPGDDVSSLAACANAIAQFHLDAAGVSTRLAWLAKNGDGSALEQARAEIAAETQLKLAKKWINRMSRTGRRRDDRETR
jgi:hypothetical protein